MDWDSLGFGLTPTAAMYVATCERGEAVRLRGCLHSAQVHADKGLRAAAPQWAAGSLQPYGPLSLSPAAGVLNYGQGIFEGMKAYRTVAGRIVLFRPDQASAQQLA